MFNNFIMNLKSILLSTLGLALGASTMWAVPARQGLHQYTQPDGSKVALQRVGDEFFHTLATPDGSAVSKGADGYYYYTTLQGISSVKVSDNPAGRPAVEGLGFATVSVQELAASRMERINKSRAFRTPAAVAKKQSQVPSTGSPRVPVLLVQYSDVKFKDQDPKQTFIEFFSTGEVSAHQYFVDQSNGKYTPQFDVYGPYTLPNKRSYYGGNDYNGEDKAVGEMVAKGCLGLDSSINFANYDNDKDGECDVVIVLYAGDGEASSMDDDYENAVWPCQWELSGSDYGRSLTLDNTKVDKFAVFNELYGLDLTRIDGIGTFCHEFSHCLDLPDFYDTQYGPHFGMGPWSLMDYGSYNNDGYTPIGYSAYEKAFMGWIDIEEGSDNTFYNLPVFNQKNIATDKAVKLTNTADPNEYFILENRKKQGWDEYISAEGLMITHVTFSQSAWNANTVNNYDLQRMTIVPADNSLKLNSSSYYGQTYYDIDEADLLGDLWPYNGVKDFTDDSKPSAKVNSGGYLGKPVNDITVNADGTISFWCMKTPKPLVAVPTDLRHSVISDTSAEIAWAPAGSEPVTYTLEVAPYKEATAELVVSTIFNSKYHDWKTDGYTNYEEGLGLRLGSNKNYGLIESPIFTTDETGIVTLRVNAAQYATDNSILYIDLIDNSYEEHETIEIPVSKQYRNYLVTIQGSPNTMSVIWLYAENGKCRVYVKEADIYTGDATSLILDATPVAFAPATSDVLTFTGLTKTSQIVTGLESGTKYEYRVKAVPVDTENFGESRWTEKNILDLTPTGVKDIIEGGNATDAEYFTLQGIRLLSVPSAPGIYIRKTAKETEKINIR